MARSSGFLSLEEIRKCPGWPGNDYIELKRVAILECVEDIPCNPCEEVCPVGAIHIGSPIANLPVIDGEKCTGCNKCIAICPGLAIFVVEKNKSQQFSTISMPYELLPLPKKGDWVEGLDRSGNNICDARIDNVQVTKNYDKTAVVTVTVEKKFCHEVRSINIP